MSAPPAPSPAEGPGFLSRPCISDRGGRKSASPRCGSPSRSLVAFLACCGVASAGPGLILGVADDDLKWTEDTKGVVAQPPGGRLQGGPRHAEVAAGPDEARRRRQAPTCAAPRPPRSSAIASSSGSSATPAAPPVQPEARTQYCSYVVDALSRAKNVHDVVIWNEANSALFWRPQQGARGRVRGAARRVLRHAAQVPAHGQRDHARPRRTRTRARSSRALGDAYRASGRAAPIFDTFGHNAYPGDDARVAVRDAPDAPSLDQGDYVRADAGADDAFGGTAQPVPGSGSDRDARDRHGRNAQPALSWPVTIWYLEDGFETVVPADKRARYTGREPNRQLVQPVAPKLRAASSRPTRRASSRTRSSSPTASPPSARSSTSSSSTRSASAAGSRACSGPTARRSRRTSPSRRVFAAVAAATVDCSRFPASGPRRASRRGAGRFRLLSSPACCEQSSSTSISRSPVPAPTSGRDGYRQLGLRYGLDLDPARYEQARAEAFAEVKRHPELDHDEEIWVLFTERIIVGHGRHRRHVRAPRSRWSGAGRSRCTSSSTTTRCRCSTRCASAA